MWLQSLARPILMSDSMHYLWMSVIVYGPPVLKYVQYVDVGTQAFSTQRTTVQMSKLANRLDSS